MALRDIWTQQSLADALYEKAGVRISGSDVSKILNTKGLRPHRVRQWLHSQDPEFKQKVSRICELYVSPPKDAILLCIDEKPMPVLKRKHPTKTGPRGIDHWNRFEAHPFNWKFRGNFERPLLDEAI
ncbi:MAG: winged helix-turn-helix domain-containing protein [Deltaproteobacteria bacterium]|nr:winged helix-turn-helix domain-containing protein [Deltaproteobacteria bacterium]